MFLFSSGEPLESGDVRGDAGGDESSVLVAVRVRPLNNTERSQGDQGVLYCPGQGTILVSEAGFVLETRQTHFFVFKLSLLEGKFLPSLQDFFTSTAGVLQSTEFVLQVSQFVFSLQVNNGVQDRAFTFDAVFEAGSSQHDVFEQCGVKRLIDLAADGFSCTVFGFGQTGSGKTYTITGPHSLFSDGLRERSFYGLMQRSFAYLLDEVQAKEGDFVLSASYLEIYNEQVRDLLNPGLTDSLTVRWTKNTGFYVENLSNVEFESLDSVMALLEGGIGSRQTSSHSQNQQSSRSHSIFTVYIESEAHPDGRGGYLARHGKLCMVDLAGSERVKETGSSGELMEEAGNINRSLLTLGNCISALVDPRKREGHIPYRDSKLTKLLADSLGGSGVTLMIACISPATMNLQETMNTLRYASRAKRIKNRPVAKRDSKERRVISLEREIKFLRMENLFLRQRLQLPVVSRKHWPENGESGSTCSSEHGGVEPAEPLKKVPPFPKHSLYDLLQEFMRENDALRQERSALLSSRESSRQTRKMLSQENGRLMRKLEDLERVISSSPLTISTQSGHSTESMSSCSSGQCPHFSSPLHRHKQVAVYPCHPGHHCHGCASDSSLQVLSYSYNLIRVKDSILSMLSYWTQALYPAEWYARPRPFVSVEDPAPLIPLPHDQLDPPRGGASLTDQHSQSSGLLLQVELPPIEFFIHENKAKHPPDPQGGLQQPQPALNQQQSVDAILPRRKKSQATSGSYANRFQLMKETRTQPGSTPPQRSQDRVLPSAPPLPSPPHLETAVLQPRRGRVKAEPSLPRQEELRAQVKKEHPRHMTREHERHGNAERRQPDRTKHPS
ncbi:kinesin-like protein KIF12 isoform X2 [Acipenser ruthenus]|uniref:kinesin-like protein KIF12 isoform X2 n=1 Tax=Acipenser ruthenus TaxID=7906 RepID=UPI00274091B8|nr:kinesin-like protein KIF12 isoform X2 [Acipenser ruthenus]